MALTGELIHVARRTADADLEHFATALRWVAMIERGDPRYLDEFHTYAARARGGGRPHLAMTADVDASIIAGLTGRFDEAESLIRTVRPDHHHDHFLYMIAHHRWAMMALRGRVEEQERLLRELRGTGHPCVPLLESLTALHAGDLDTALRRFDDQEPDDRMIQPIWVRLQAELAAATQDPELCARARSCWRRIGGSGRWRCSAGRSAGRTISGWAWSTRPRSAGRRRWKSSPPPTGRPTRWVPGRGPSWPVPTWPRPCSPAAPPRRPRACSKGCAGRRRSWGWSGHVRSRGRCGETYTPATPLSPARWRGAPWHCWATTGRTPPPRPRPSAKGPHRPRGTRRPLCRAARRPRPWARADRWPGPRSMEARRPWP
ncbi:hypothetical protein ACFQYP_55290 [Nonomuraea antimicrobica]